MADQWQEWLTPHARRPAESSTHGGGTIVLDIRATTPEVQEHACLAVIDALVAEGIRDEIVIVADYELTGLAYELDLRPETRGLYRYNAERRSDGAWACLLRRTMK